MATDCLARVARQGDWMSVGLSSCGSPYFSLLLICWLRSITIARSGYGTYSVRACTTIEPINLNFTSAGYRDHSSSRWLRHGRPDDGIVTGAILTADATSSSHHRRRGGNTCQFAYCLIAPDTHAAHMNAYMHAISTSLPGRKREPRRTEAPGTRVL